MARRREIEKPSQIGPETEKQIRKTDDGKDKDLIGELLKNRGQARALPLSLERERNLILEEYINRILANVEDLLLRPDFAEKGKITQQSILAEIKNAPVPEENAAQLKVELEEIIKNFQENDDKNGKIKQLRIDLNKIKQEFLYL